MDKREARSIFFPLVLITIGLVFLLKTVGVIQNDPGELLFRLWPLLFIIGGIDHILQGKGWVWAVISLGLGTVFLLANFNYLPEDALSLLLRLWPLILIAIGLDLIFQGHSVISRIIGALLGLGLVVVIVWWAVAGSPVTSRATEPIEISLGKANTATLDISIPVGQIEIKAGAGDGNLVDGYITQSASKHLQQSYKVNAGIGNLVINSSGTFVFPWVDGFRQLLWQLRLTSEIPLAIAIDSSVGGQTLDLRGLDVDSLDLTAAIGSIEIVLPSEEEFDGRISTPIGSVKILVPSGALVEIKTDTGLSFIQVPEGFTRQGDVIYSPGASSANALIHLVLEQPIGRLIVEQLP
jgi:hypothetical protein